MGKAVKFKKSVGQKKKKRDDDVWRGLLPCLMDVVDQKPWDVLDFTDPVAWISEDYERMVFFMCIDDGQDPMSILIFPSYEDYQRMMEEQETIRQEMRCMIELTCYGIAFCFKEELTDEMLEIYRRLSVDFGDGLWPEFSYKRWGYAEELPRGEELLFLMECLGNFCMELRALREFKSRPDFDSGKMLVRYYDADEKLWMNAEAPFVKPPEQRRVVSVDETSPALQALKELPRSTSARKMEFEIGWRKKKEQQKAKDTPYYPVQIILTNRETGEALALPCCQPEDKLQCVFYTWEEVLQKYGRPEALYVCRNETYDLIESLAQNLGIKIKYVKRLPAAERILRKLGGV